MVDSAGVVAPTRLPRLSRHHPRPRLLRHHPPDDAHRQPALRRPAGRGDDARIEERTYQLGRSPRAIDGHLGEIGPRRPRRRGFRRRRCRLGRALQEIPLARCHRRGTRRRPRGLVPHLQRDAVRLAPQPGVQPVRLDRHRGAHDHRRGRPDRTRCHRRRRRTNPLRRETVRPRTRRERSRQSPAEGAVQHRLERGGRNPLRQNRHTPRLRIDPHARHDSKRLLVHHCGRRRRNGRTPRDGADEADDQRLRGQLRISGLPAHRPVEQHRPETPGLSGHQGPVANPNESRCEKRLDDHRATRRCRRRAGRRGAEFELREEPRPAGPIPRRLRFDLR